MTLIRLLLCLLSFLALPVAAGPTRAQDTATQHVMLSLLPEFGQVEPGGTLFVGIRQEIEAGWHTYWRNPGDSGEPPRIDWKLPAGFSAGTLRWPIPERIVTGPLTSFGHEGTVTLIQELRAPDPLPEGPLEIAAAIEILVCKEICIPEYHDVSFTLNGQDAASIDNSEVISIAFAATPGQVNWNASYRIDEGGAFNLALDVKLPGLITTGGERMKFDIFPYEWGVVDNSAATAIKADERFTSITLRRKAGDRPLHGVGDLDAVVTYTNLETGQTGALEITAKPDPAWLEAARAQAPQPEVTAASLPSATAPLSAGAPPVTLGLALLFALLGGLVLNLMPCVFPILSMKALSLAQMAEKSAGAARLHGLAYTAGVLASFAALAGLLLALQAGGAQIGWGFQLQNPLVVLLLSWLLFLIGLNLSGFFEIGALPFAGSMTGGGHGLRESFMTGILATLVATPCTAPFMGAALGFAVTQPAVVAMAIFLALGFGLALPFLLLAAFPPLRRFLPRPGAWMITFREFLAFPMYASAAWLVWVFGNQTGDTALLAALCGFVAIGFAIWMLRAAPPGGGGRIVLRGLAFIVTVTALGIGIGESLKPSAPAQTPSATAPSSFLFGEAFTPERLATLLEGNDPVFVNMTADWCITCKINERTSLSSQQIHTLFAAQKVAYLKGDWTRQDPAITSYLAGYGRSGVPLYVFYGARDTATGNRPEPVVLPQILTPGLIAGIIKPES